jgi:hypothetical protein
VETDERELAVLLLLLEEEGGGGGRGTTEPETFAASGWRSKKASCPCLFMACSVLSVRSARSGSSSGP